MFKEIDKIQEKLEERRKVLNWVIDGLGIHGFKIKDASTLSWDYITTFYNVEPEPKTEVIMKNKDFKDIRVIPASGKRQWIGGAYTLAFVYSNKGNFLLKGYGAEIREYLQGLKSKGYKYILNETLWSTDSWTGEKNFRSIWSVSSQSTYIDEPEPKSRYRKEDKFKWVIKRFNEHGEDTQTLKFKRLPNKWVPEYDTIIY